MWSSERKDKISFPSLAGKSHCRPRTIHLVGDGVLDVPCGASRAQKDLGRIRIRQCAKSPKIFLCPASPCAVLTEGVSPYGSRLSLSSNGPSVARPPAPFQRQTPSRRLPLSRGSICSPERYVAVGAGFGAAHQNAARKPQDHFYPDRTNVFLYTCLNLYA